VPWTRSVGLLMALLSVTEGSLPPLLSISKGRPERNPIQAAKMSSTSAMPTLSCGIGKYESQQHAV
jgi:hypothetical protein